VRDAIAMIARAGVIDVDWRNEIVYAMTRFFYFIKQGCEKITSVHCVTMLARQEKKHHDRFGWRSCCGCVLLFRDLCTQCGDCVHVIKCVDVVDQTTFGKHKKCIAIVSRLYTQ